MIKSKTFIATPPGATIKEQLVDRGITQKEFAFRMDMSQKHISKLINGEVELTHNVADRLEMVLGLPASFWNNLESIYREKIIKAKNENEMDKEIELARKFPYSEMANLNWVAHTRKAIEKVVNLRKFFEVVKLEKIFSLNMPKVSWRKLSDDSDKNFIWISWVQKAKLEARKITTKPINISRLRESIPEIRLMTCQNPEMFYSNLIKILADCGIALVLIPHLQGSFLHGATFYDNNGNKIVLGLTVRGADADKFWFSLFHEIGHIILGTIGKSEEEIEKEADKYASTILIDENALNKFISKDDLGEDAIKLFANSIEIDPGIVVGRLQKKGLIDYSQFNYLKKQYQLEIYS